MAKKRRLNTGKKVREMRLALGGRRAVVEVMESGSVSSLKRWERRECAPISAHVKVVGDAYDMWLLMKKAVRRRFQKR